jgi:hypothetical protein
VPILSGNWVSHYHRMVVVTSGPDRLGQVPNLESGATTNHGGPLRASRLEESLVIRLGEAPIVGADLSQPCVELNLHLKRDRARAECSGTMRSRQSSGATFPLGLLDLEPLLR